MSQVNKIVHLPVKPKSPDHIGQMVTSNHRAEWTDTVYENYENVSTTNTFSKLFL